MERQAKDMNMKKIKHVLLALLGLVLTLPLDAETGTDQVLWFSVSDSAKVEDIVGNFCLISDYKDVFGNPINAVRVRVAGDDAAGDKFLTLFWQDETGNWETAEGATTALFDAKDTSTYPMWQPADITAYANPDQLFELQLGYVGDGANAEFATLATAQAYYRDLTSHISSGGVSLQDQVPWAPELYAVPEPSGCLLLLVGGALLALRRKRLTDPASLP